MFKVVTFYIRNRHTCQDKVIPGFSAHVKIIKKKMIFASLNSALNLKAAGRHD